MRGRRVSATLCLLISAVGTGCAAGEARDDWDPAAVRAVARAAAAGGDVAVLHAAGRPPRDELPWGIRQTLTTAGFMVVDSTAVRDPDGRVLVLESSRPDGTDWIVRTYMLQPGGAGPSTEWLVRCQADLCEASAQ
ncbi:MAG TPA: hypothetical protein VK929_00920 [Longimicrobiales bacterium]|nr:hypothetical protein [Longimicrobiales bacterium]